MKATMKRVLTAVLLLLLVCANLGALAAGADYSNEGNYVLNITMPAGRSSADIDDLPSITAGTKLGRIDSGSALNTVSTYRPQDLFGAYLGVMAVYNCESWVSLRQRPDADSARLTTVPFGARVEAYYYSPNWYGCYYNGMYGFIKTQYLTERVGKVSPPTTYNDPYDLSNYEYRRVSTRGRGALVFQSSPGGSFMKSYKYNEGDWIYVNTSWRSQGYAMAYEGGTYGYVDASYISW